MNDCATCRQALTYDACVEIREAVELAEQLGADREHLRATLVEALARLEAPLPGSES